MKFEYDENKSRSNKLKHNIDFEEVKQLWKDDNIRIIAARRSRKKEIEIYDSRRI